MNRNAEEVKRNLGEGNDAKIKVFLLSLGERSYGWDKGKKQRQIREHRQQESSAQSSPPLAFDRLNLL